MLTKQNPESASWYHLTSTSRCAPCEHISLSKFACELCRASVSEALPQDSRKDLCRLRANMISTKTAGHGHDRGIEATVHLAEDILLVKPIEKTGTSPASSMY